MNHDGSVGAEYVLVKRNKPTTTHLWSIMNAFYFNFRSLLVFFPIHILELGFSLLAYINTYRFCRETMATNATLCCRSCRSTCQLQRPASGLRGPFFFLDGAAQTVCMQYMFEWFQFQIPQWTHLSQSHCLLCCPTRQPNTLCTVFSLFFHTDLRREM